MCSKVAYYVTHLQYVYIQNSTYIHLHAFIINCLKATQALNVPSILKLDLEISQMDTLLSSTVSVQKYKAFVEDKNALKIVEFIKPRFSERYIEQMRVDPNKNNGFTIMAVSCLMIKSIEFFYQGRSEST